MPRPVPQYSWGLTKGEPLKNESHTHRMKGKSKGKGYKTDKPAAGLPKRNTLKADVHYGSHAKIASLIGAEMRRMGL